MKANNAGQPTVDIVRFLPTAPKSEFMGLVFAEPRGRILTICPRHNCHAVTARFETASVITTLSTLIRKHEKKPEKAARREFPDALELRRNAGVTQVEMAKVLGVCIPTMAMMEKGKRLWSEQEIKRFLKRIGG